jgi:acetolactate synthase-1/2/3 large subunit
MTALGAAGATVVPVLNAMAQQEMPLPIPSPVMPTPPIEVAPAPPAMSDRVYGRMTGAQAAVRAMQLEGVPCVFGVPGAQSNELWDEMKAAGQPYFLVTNESSASVMADASARVTGRVGAFAVVPGPGLTNAMTGIGEAAMDTVPIVGIVTDVQRGAGAPVGQVHGLYNAAILRPVCKAVYEIHHCGQIAGAIHQAFRVARSGAPGPTAVVIPYNLLMEVWDFNEPVPYDLAPPWDEACYRKALQVLQDRKKKVGIFAGMGCAGSSEKLIRVAEMLQAPVATTVSGKGVIPDGHPLAVGWGYGPYGTRTAEAIFGKDVDIVLAVGTRFSEVSTANYSIPRLGKLIHVDIDPAVLAKNVPTDVAVCADSGQFFDRLIADAGAIAREPRPQLVNTIARRREKDKVVQAQVEVRGGVDPMHLLWHMNRCLGDSSWLFVDVTASTHFAAEAIDRQSPRHYFTPADNQSMGWAIPAAVGAQRIDPGRRVVCVTGDGCFLMSGLEVSTAARSALPVKFFVLDDGAYHYMQMLQEPLYGRTTATEIAQLDYGAMARGMGVVYNEILANDQIEAGLARAFGVCAPVLTRVTISYDGRELRWLKALRSSYLDKLKTMQVARVAGRSAVRAANPLLKDD